VSTKLIIEARVNEYAPRDVNPNVPFTPEEIGSDASSCREAGAAIVHFHPRTGTGAPDLSYDTYERVMKLIRAGSDILVQPTLGALVQSPDPKTRIENLQRLVEAGLKPDFAPLDMGSTNSDVMDDDGTAFLTEDLVYVNSTATLRFFADTLRELSIKPYLHLWNLAHLRLAATFHRLGLLKGPLWAGFCLSADSAPIYHPASAAGLQAYLTNIPDNLPVVWAVNAFRASLLDLAPQIIKAGGHIAIGLGDHHYAENGAPTNAELIRQVADLARNLGRDVATPQEAHEILGPFLSA
jgi:3-keto-5-aminohexanoate cleavage enzyme